MWEPSVFSRAWDEDHAKTFKMNSVIYFEQVQGIQDGCYATGSPGPGQQPSWQQHSGPVAGGLMMIIYNLGYDQLI